MRKLIAAEFMTLDGVIQNEENDGDGFKYGGWFFSYADEVTGAVVQERLAKPVDLLLGRKTFDGWEKNVEHLTGALATFAEAILV